MDEITKLYDFLYEYAGPDAANALGMGRNSASWAKEVSNAFTLLTELPYFTDRGAELETPSGYTRAQCMLEEIEASGIADREMREVLGMLSGLISDDNPFFPTLAPALDGSDGDAEAKKKMVEQDEEYGAEATHAERFSSVCEPLFYRLLQFGMLIRLIQWELSRGPSGRQELERAKLRAQGLFDSRVSGLLAQLDYEAVPIRKLVAMQLESGLIIIDLLKEEQ